MYKNVQINLCNRIYYSQIKLNQIDFRYNFRMCISKLCSMLNIDGLRGDIVLNRSIRAIMVLEEDLIPIIKSVRKMAVLGLIHRIRKDPLERINLEYKVHAILVQIFVKQAHLRA